MIPKLVAIIDDDLDDVEIMKGVFVKISHNLHCISFDHSAEAIRELCKDKFPVPDFIILDLNMPIMSGRECLAELRRIKKFETTPIIIFSTSISGPTAQDLKQKGATLTFEKPCSMDSYFSLFKEMILSRVN